MKNLGQFNTFFLDSYTDEYDNLCDIKNHLNSYETTIVTKPQAEASLLYQELQKFDALDISSTVREEGTKELAIKIGKYLPNITRVTLPDATEGDNFLELALDLVEYSNLEYFVMGHGNTLDKPLDIAGLLFFGLPSLMSFTCRADNDGQKEELAQLNEARDQFYIDSIRSIICDPIILPINEVNIAGLVVEYAVPETINIHVISG